MMAEIRRPLSAVERWYWLSDQFSALNVISRVRVHGRLSIDDLRRGLDALQARHPLLRARIEQPDRGATRGGPRARGPAPPPRPPGGGGGGGPRPPR
ncbi:hypothetical protein OFL26_02570, partial [Pseudomonas aeruginosa]|nr:hypothetical protein [Pseudomonas aeruginosa]